VFQGIWKSSQKDTSEQIAGKIIHSTSEFVAKRIADLGSLKASEDELITALSKEASVSKSFIFCLLFKF